MRKKFLTEQEKEELTPFQAGQIDILNWLECTVERELSQIRGKTANELLALNNEEIEITRAHKKVNEMLLWNIQQTKKAIKNQGK